MLFRQSILSASNARRPMKTVLALDDFVKGKGHEFYPFPFARAKFLNLSCAVQTQQIMKTIRSTDYGKLVVVWADAPDSYILDRDLKQEAFRTASWCGLLADNSKGSACFAFHGSHDFVISSTGYRHKQKFAIIEADAESRRRLQQVLIRRRLAWEALGAVLVKK